jgi:hypothetical protein
MMAGFVDILSRRAVGGWAADMDMENVNRPAQIKIFVNGAEYCKVTADAERNDLAGTGRYGDGRHGFHFDPPLSPTESRSISIRYAETNEALPRGEQVFAPVADAEPSGAVRPLTPIVRGKFTVNASIIK